MSAQLPVTNRKASTSKSQTVAAVPLFGHTEMLLLLAGMGGAALAAAVPYPGKVTRISHKGE